MCKGAAAVMQQVPDVPVYAAVKQVDLNEPTSCTQPGEGILACKSSARDILPHAMAMCCHCLKCSFATGSRIIATSCNVHNLVTALTCSSTWLVCLCCTLIQEHRRAVLHSMSLLTFTEADLITFRADCQDSLPDALLGSIANDHLRGAVFKAVVLL